MALTWLGRCQMVPRKAGSSASTCSRLSEPASAVDSGSPSASSVVVAIPSRMVAS